MLDADTKRRIDTARDILVGKVPDPKSQVEQITIALIYKFMDDIDAEAEELGGERTFFAGEFARYGWAKLMRTGLGGHETLNLYAEAISLMPENPGIPQLFRDIFRNAFLPYRDPETLRAFLKVIDEFSYDNSERLGDAFEYLLSVLGSQGDAGQFRTPRHIIDFIVAIIDPKKDEVVLDPACGTAGFLISSYKHIQQANEGEDGSAGLTPEEKGRLAVNFKGYDISPDMVRLSLVNMYLHGFTAPQIFEYDTLTSDDRWNEYTDVILANPPFMSPKGGIRPHNRFTVQSKRSEVLFVDYMAGHLTPSGRAGIIVPEGIIFQSQNTHRQLRKMLVEDYLVAVVSLPAGVFNPYSGVKTSILILDRSLAKRTDSIAFFKVEKDGFDLGAQRRPSEINDLPQVKAELGQYLTSLRAGETMDHFRSTLGMVIRKERVTADGEHNLSGERYRENEAPSMVWPMVSLGEIVAILDSLRRPITKHYRKPGPYPYYGATGILDYVDGYLFDEPLVLVGEDGAKWGPRESSSFGIKDKVWVNNHAHVLRPRREHVMDSYLIEVLNQMDLTQYTTGVTVPKLNQSRLKSIQIPLPPLKVQCEIVAEIEGYQKVLDGARAVVQNYRPHIAVDPEWPEFRVDALCELGRGRVISKHDINANPGPYPVYSSQTSGNGVFGYLGSYDFEGEYVTWTTDGANAGTVFYRIGSFNCTNVCGTLRAKEDAVHEVNMKYLAQVLGQLTKPYVVQVGNPKLMNKEVARIPIPMPCIATQQTIVAEIEAEQALVKTNRKLIQRFEKKIHVAVERVWGK